MYTVKLLVEFTVAPTAGHALTEGGAQRIARAYLLDEIEESGLLEGCEVEYQSAETMGRDTLYTVPTYRGDDRNAPKGTGDHDSSMPARVLVREEDGLRIVLGSHVYDPRESDCPDLCIERRPGGWSVLVHNEGGSDCCGGLAVLDNGDVYAIPEEHSANVMATFHAADYIGIRDVMLLLNDSPAPVAPESTSADEYDIVEYGEDTYGDDGGDVHKRAWLVLYGSKTLAEFWYDDLSRIPQHKAAIAYLESVQNGQPPITSAVPSHGIDVCAMSKLVVEMRDTLKRRDTYGPEEYLYSSVEIALGKLARLLNGLPEMPTGGHVMESLPDSTPAPTAGTERVQ